MADEPVEPEESGQVDVEEALEQLRLEGVLGIGPSASRNRTYAVTGLRKAWERDSSVAYANGRSCLRAGDYKSAAIWFEACWHKCRDIVHLGDVVPLGGWAASGFVRDELLEGIDDECDLSEGDELTDDSDDESSSESDVESQSPERRTSSAATVGRENSTNPDALKHKQSVPLLLCLVFSKLQAWAQVDAIATAALETRDFGPTDHKGCPTQMDPGDEESYMTLMVSRGVSNVLLGPENFQRARGAFSLANRVQPRNRNCQRGLECIAFLEEQIGLGSEASREACTSALSALAASVSSPASRAASRCVSRNSR